MRKTYEVTGCTFDASAFCPEHCPDPEACESEHGAIFLGSEWDCPGPACDTCFALIETTQLHNRDCEHALAVT